jgi:hypothetical protein
VWIGSAKSTLPDPVAPLHHREVLREQLEILEHHTRDRRDRPLPARPRGIGERGLYQVKIVSAVVGPDVEAVLPVSDRVEGPRPAPFDQAQLPGRIVRVQQVLLGRNRALEVENQVATAPALVEVQVEGAILFLIEQLVRRLVFAEAMSVQAVRPERRIERAVEEGAGVVPPLQRVVGVANAIFEQLTRRQVYDEDVVSLASVGIDRIGRESLIGADLEVPDPEEVVALGQRVLVEDDFLRCVGPCSLAAAVGVLFPGLAARVVEIVAVPFGDRSIDHRQPHRHLVVQRRLQRLGRRHRRQRVLVLGSQILDDRRIGAVAHPVVFVDERPAVALDLVGPLRGDRRGGRPVEPGLASRARRCHRWLRARHPQRADGDPRQRLDRPQHPEVPGVAHASTFSLAVESPAEWAPPLLTNAAENVDGRGYSIGGNDSRSARALSGCMRGPRGG